MPIALTAPLGRVLLGAKALLLATVLATAPATAESAYIAQSPKGALMPTTLTAATKLAPSIGNPAFSPSRLAASAAAATAGGRNFAQNLQIGNYNQIAQIQSGSNNYSSVGIIAGNANSVGVLQAGNNLRSNVVLLNTQGLSVGVLQPNGSAPVNMLIARLPNGGLLIKR